MFSPSQHRSGSAPRVSRGGFQQDYNSFSHTASLDTTLIQQDRPEYSRVSRQSAPGRFDDYDSSARVDLRLKAIELEEAEQLRKSLMVQKDREHSHQVSELGNQVRQLRDYLSKAESKNYELNLKMAELETSNRILKERVINLEQQCHDYQINMSELQTHIRITKERQAIQESEMESDYKSRLEKLQDVIAAQGDHMTEIEIQRETEFNTRINEMQTVIRQLKEKNITLETDVKKLNAEKESVTATYKSTAESLTKAQIKIQEQSELIRIKESEITKHTMNIRSSQFEAENVRSQVRVMEDELSKRSNDISILQSQLGAAKETEKRLADTETQLSQCHRDNDMLRSDIARLHADVEVLETRKKNDEMVLYEIEKLRHNNARLIQLLASTVEFQDFLNDARDSAGMSFVVPRNGPKKKMSAFSQSEIDEVISAPVMDRIRRSDMPQISSKKERDNWVPEQIHQIAHFFMKKYLPDVDPLLINDFIQTMNHIFRDREEKKVTRIKTQHAEEISLLQKEWRSRMPYDSVIKAGKIQYLKKELKKALDSNRKTGHVDSKYAHLLESSLSAFESISEQQGIERVAVRDDTGFMEGVFWLHTKVEGFLNLLLHKISSVSVEYQKQALELSSTPADFGSRFIRLQTSFLEEVDAILSDTRQFLKDSLHDAKRMSYGMSPQRPSTSLGASQLSYSSPKHS